MELPQGNNGAELLLWREALAKALVEDASADRNLWLLDTGPVDQWTFRYEESVEAIENPMLREFLRRWRYYVVGQNPKHVWVTHLGTLAQAAGVFDRLAGMYTMAGWSEGYRAASDPDIVK